MGYVIKNIILLFFSIFLALLAAEGLIRIFSPQTTLVTLENSSMRIFAESSYNPFTLRPNSNEIQRDILNKEFNSIVTINSEGLRESTKAMKTRIMFIGDSFTFGYGVGDNETFVHLLSRKYGVINAGYVAGLSPDTYYLWLEKEGLNYNPDLIVLDIFVGNDISDVGDNDWIADKNGLPLKINSKIYYVDGENRLRNKDYSVYNRLGLWLWKHSHFYNFARNKLQVILLSIRQVKNGNNCIYCDNYYQNENWRKTEKILEAIKNITQNKLVVVLMPAKEQVDDAEWRNYQSIAGNNIERELPQEKLIEFLNSHNIKYIDLLPYFKKSNKNNDFYYKKDIHMNKFGHELIANILKDRLTNISSLSVSKH